jgi:predicted GNAT superfamily acetyltransferase
MLTYRIATQPEDMQAVADLEIVIWGIASRDIFPPHMLSLAQHHGGVILVAEEASQMIAFCISFPARRNGEWCLWSYVTGVHPGYQGQNIGAMLKRKQLQWAKQNGYETIHWTFDPLQLGNANFNLNRLGVVACQYHENIYGVMEDAINRAGLPSDRLEAVWHTTAPQIPTMSDTPPFFLVQQQDHLPIINLNENDYYLLAIAIPTERYENLVLWQNAIRRAFQHAFSINYEAFRFVVDAPTPHYLLRKRL